MFNDTAPSKPRDSRPWVFHIVFPMPTRDPPIMTAEEARLLLLGAQSLLHDPSRRATLTSLDTLIRAMGFVQIDTINTVERAHHLTLASRLDGYRQHMLHDLLESKRTLFEHWTHDASAIPVEWFAHWKPRFARYRKRVRENKWWQKRIGDNPTRMIRHVMKRIEREGPLLSRDFEHQPTTVPPAEKGWWGWKPQKAALEYLWRSGELAITKRINFQKAYDLTHRVYPEHHAAARPAKADHIDWACRSALDRLGVATPKELADFWNALYAEECKKWCERAEKQGEIVCVLVESADGSKPVEAFAPHDWRKRIAKLPSAPDRMRLLNPFDPILRDRKRAMRLFKFDYRFEAFVPEAKRVHGYYVMPILEGDRLVGRIDPKFDRAHGTLLVRNIWWEKGIKPTRPRKNALNEAIERLASFIGASKVHR